VSHLEVSGLSVRYGAVRALHDVALDVEPGESVALLGANGAGKTTVLRAIGGLLGLSPRLRRRRGDPLRGAADRPRGRVGAGRRRHRAGARGPARLRRADRRREPARRRLRRPRPAPRRRRARRAARALPDPARAPRPARRPAQRRSAADARDRAGDHGPAALLLLDEPSLGLAPIVVAEIADALRRINAGGTAILIADQNTTLALRATDRAYLLESGRVRSDAPTEQLVLDDALRASYLGTAAGHEQVAQEVTAMTAQPLLSIRDLALRFGAVTAFAGVSFDVARGELFAVIGPTAPARARCSTRCRASTTPARAT
jgi:branched-chain amino acid transport system ATP-binding protein